MEKFTAVYEKIGDFWMGSIEELPGANTQGRTVEETRENLIEAVQLIIESNRELSKKETNGKKIIKEELVVPI